MTTVLQWGVGSVSLSVSGAQMTKVFSALTLPSQAFFSRLEFIGKLSHGAGVENTKASPDFLFEK